jgi:membrane-bound metal-dependent hydrolase YbcI (DUF457 family)
MPSPIGHALAGWSAGWLIAPPPGPEVSRQWWARAALFAGAGMAADLDLLVGAHRGPSHSVGAAAMVAGLVLVAGLRWRDSGGQVGFALAVAAAYATHPLLDWLGADTSPPLGVMAFWPFSREYVQSPVEVFLAISRRYSPKTFWRQNLHAVARELFILLPVLALVWWLRRCPESGSRAESPRTST